MRQRRDPHSARRIARELRLDDELGLQLQAIFVRAGRANRYLRRLSERNELARHVGAAAVVLRRRGTALRRRPGRRGRAATHSDSEAVAGTHWYRALAPRSLAAARTVNQAVPL